MLYSFSEWLLSTCHEVGSVQSVLENTLDPTFSPHASHALPVIEARAPFIEVPQWFSVVSSTHIVVSTNQTLMSDITWR